MVDVIAKFVIYNLNIINMKKLLILLLFIATFSCQNVSQRESNSSCHPAKCKIYNEDQAFQDQFFPFDFKEYQTLKLSGYFSRSTKVDSAEINNQGYISHIYNFSDGKSNVNFFVKTYDTTDLWFYLNTSTIQSNIMNFKNGIKIGMLKSDFNKVLKTDCQCDTFLIEEGDMAISFYFIFEDNHLQKIDILAPEE